MEWLREILKGLENADDLEKRIAGGIGKSFVSKEDFNTLNTTKKKLEDDISALKKDMENGEDFKLKFEALEKQVEADRVAAEEATREAAAEVEFQNRFQGVVGENKWRDELTAKAVYSEFKAALLDETNKGKGDKDIFEVLTKDKDYYANPNKPADMPGMGNTSLEELDESKMRAIMGLPAKE